LSLPSQTQNGINYSTEDKMNKKAYKFFGFVLIIIGVLLAFYDIIRYKRIFLPTNAEKIFTVILFIICFGIISAGLYVILHKKFGVPQYIYKPENISTIMDVGFAIDEYIQTESFVSDIFKERCQNLAAELAHFDTIWGECILKLENLLEGTPEYNEKSDNLNKIFDTLFTNLRVLIYKLHSINSLHYINILGKHTIKKILNKGDIPKNLTETQARYAKTLSETSELLKATRIVLLDSISAIQE
jgi:hypothetical protein